MEKYSFFDAVMTGDGAYDRTYNSADVADYFSSFVGNGVYANPANSLMVVEHNASNIIKVKPGKAWINGYFFELSEKEKEISVPLGDALSPRIDTVVLALDLQKRLMEIALIKGTPSASPKATAPVRNDQRYELVLAQVRVEAGSAKIPQRDITDCRMNKELCGVVSGIVDQIDTTGLFAQYNDEFNVWFETMKGTLEGDVAANLTSQIANVQKEMKVVTQKVDGIPTIRSGSKAPDNSVGVNGDIYFQILA